MSTKHEPIFWSQFRGYRKARKGLTTLLNERPKDVELTRAWMDSTNSEISRIHRFRPPLFWSVSKIQVPDKDIWLFLVYDRIAKDVVGADRIPADEEDFQFVGGRGGAL